jgi:hypothetical protein
VNPHLIQILPEACDGALLLTVAAGQVVVGLLQVLIVGCQVLHGVLLHQQLTLGLCKDASTSSSSSSASQQAECAKPQLADGCSIETEKTEQATT